MFSWLPLATAALAPPTVLDQAISLEQKNVTQCLVDHCLPQVKACMADTVCSSGIKVSQSASKRQHVTPRDFCSRSLVLLVCSA